MILEYILSTHHQTQVTLIVQIHIISLLPSALFLAVALASLLHSIQFPHRVDKDFTDHPTIENQCLGGHSCYWMWPCFGCLFVLFGWFLRSKFICRYCFKAAHWIFLLLPTNFFSKRFVYSNWCDHTVVLRSLTCESQSTSFQWLWSHHFQ